MVPFDAPPETDDQPSTSGKEYLCYFLHRLLDFRRPEFESVAELAGCTQDQLRWRMPAGDLEHSPFWYVTLPSEETAKSIGQRALLTKVRLRGRRHTWRELTVRGTSPAGSRATKPGGSRVRVCVQHTFAFMPRSTTPTRHALPQALLQQLIYKFCLWTPSHA